MKYWLEMGQEKERGRCSHYSAADGSGSFSHILIRVNLPWSSLSYTFLYSCSGFDIHVESSITSIGIIIESLYDLCLLKFLKHGMTQHK